MNFKGKRVLITGGSGFIGSNLINKLKALKAEIVNFDISSGNDIFDKKALEKAMKT